MENLEKNQNTTEVVEKEPGKNVLGILSVVFAGVSLIGSWIPLLNVISIIFGIAAIIMGVISLVFVLTKKSAHLPLPIIGIVLSIISIAISNGINTAVSDSLSGKDTPDTKVSSSSSSSTTSGNSTNSSSKSDDSKNDSSSSNTTNTDSEDKEYKVGDTISVSNQELTVTKVQRNYSPKYGSAKDGQEYVKVTLKLANKSDKTISAYSTSFKVQDSNGVIEDRDSSSYSLDDYFDYSDLASNGTKTGSLVFEVPKGDNNLTFIYEPNMFSDKQVKIKLQ